VPADLVVFDFDGTLTRGDTLVLFLATVDPARAARYTPAAVARARRHPDRRDQLKEDLIARVLRRRSDDEVRAAGRRFARRVVPRLLRPDVVAHLRDHQRAGRQVAVASASPEAVVVPAARALGVDQVVCTRLTAPGPGPGRWSYDGENCRGSTKLERVQGLARDLGVDRLWCYGNLPDDGPLLESADVAFVVGRRRLPAPSRTG
jgi:phosphatidylglycerophosphatase C